jgi:branched-chain amino acid transport system permease protein
VLLQALLTGVLMGLLFALIALGLTIIFGVMEFVNFAHGEFLLVGMLTAFYANLWLGLDPVLAIPLSGAAAAILGLLTYHLLVRHVIRGPMIAQLFSTFGLMLFLQNLFLYLVGSNYKMVKKGWLVGKSIRLADGLVVDLSVLSAGLVAVIAFALVHYLFNRTTIGLAMRATALDGLGASLMGIKTERINYLAWALGSGVVGIAGALLSNFYYIYPTVGLVFVMIAFATVALGGFGSISGAFVAGILIGLIEVLGGLYLGAQFKFTIVYAAYLAVVILRPKGLLGW